MKRSVRLLTVVLVSILTTLAASYVVAGYPRPAAAQHTSAPARRALNQLRMEVIVKTVNSAYWQTVINGARKAAAQFGVQALNFTGTNSEANIAGQISLMENAIARHPDFIVLAPTSANPLDSVITRAYNAGIKMIIIDSSATTNNYQSFLATNNHEGGCLAANTLAAAIKAKTGRAAGQVAYATFLSGVGSLGQRDKGFTDCIAQYPNIHIVRHLDAGGDQSTKPISIAADTLTAFPHLVGYFADNLYTEQGAENAFTEHHVNMSKVSLVGFDNTAKEVTALKNHKLDGVILQDPYQMGYGGVAYGILAAAGLRVPKNVDTGVSVATPANVNSAAIQGLLYPDTKRGLGF
ncbi:MAG: substrate-binding domain-containing protein [Chloroflexi bacterium]|nr:substrate-binding domain-containing protein [Chloroflexota bacterium]